MRQRRMQWVGGVAVVALAALTSGCDSLIDEDDLPGASVKATISAAEGGTLELTGAALTIPAGALDEDTEIEIQATTQQAEVDGFVARSPLYRFSPSGLVFKVPAQVTLDHASTSLQARVFWTLPGDESQFEEVPTQLGTPGKAVAEVTHFSKGFVGGPPDPKDEPRPAQGGDCVYDGGYLDECVPDSDEPPAYEEPGDGDPDTGGTPDAGTGGTDPGGEEPPPEPVQCNMLENTADFAWDYYTDGPAPAPAGGTLVPGIYELAEYRNYSGGTSGMTYPPSQTEARRTLQFLDDGTAMMVTERATATFEVSTDDTDHSISMAPTCPSNADMPYQQYTASENELLIMHLDSSSSAGFVSVWRRRL